MAFQKGTTASSGAYRDLLVDLVAFATSKHISAIAINNAGSGYTAGDLLTITHAGAYLDATIEVLTVDGGGAILTAAIRNSGAFSNRVATVAINAAGSGYVAGDIVRLTTGTFTEFCKVRVDTVGGGGAAATVSVFETGGAYSVAPDATGGATNSDIGTGTGSGLTIDTTMTTLVGTSGIAATGGTGASATFDLTLDDTGWSAATAGQNRNDYSFNAITNEKELILRGSVTGGDEPLVSIRSYTATVGLDTRYGWCLNGMDGYSSGLAHDSQPNIGPQVSPSANNGVCFFMFDNAQDYWMRVNGRRIVVVVKAVGTSITSYTSMYAGLLAPFGTTSEMPYPMYLSATSSVHNRAPDAGGFLATGLTEVFADTLTSCPAFFRRPTDGAWTRVQNVNNGTALATYVIYPLGEPNGASGSATNEDNLSDDGQFVFHLAGMGISLASGAAASQAFMPSNSDNETLLVPATLISTPVATDNTADVLVIGELEDVFWLSVTKADGTVMLAEDIIEVGSDQYRIFQNAHRSERYSYFALKET